MKKGAMSRFDLVAKLSIQWKFGIMMGGFMLILLAATFSTFWTANLQKDDAKVINIAGRQRMLSQKMTKEAFALIQGRGKKEEMQKTENLFDKSLTDLISGNAEENIPPTKEEHIRTQLGKVQDMWRKFRLNLDKLADLNEERLVIYKVLINNNVPLLKDMNDAVFMMDQENLDARTVNIAGRQRMLSQKMTKEALSLESGDITADELMATVALFDKSLKGLIEGDKELGLRPMKHSAILAQLRKVEEKWKPFKENMEKLVKIAGSSGEYRDYLLANNVPLLKEMNKAVGQYETASTAKVKYLKIIQMVLLVITVIFFGTGWFLVTNPIIRSFTAVTTELAEKTRDITGVTIELTEGAKAQTGIVQSATKELEEMVISIIQGSITLSVEKQVEISKAFSEFLTHFVERTSSEIAMGMMSITQQSQEARKSMEDFVAELGSVEENVRSQEEAVEGMVEALKSIVDANEEIKTAAQGSTEAADVATSKAFLGQERIEVMSNELQEIGSSSKGVRDVIDSLATITESIKILALNMSLKVEDIKDDTGKSYGFEAMSAKVQQLAEEVEALLGNSKEMIIPTIEGLAKVSTEANQTKEVIAEVTSAIKTADDKSKEITERIIKQASDIDRVEVEAENLRALAHKTTEAIEAQGGLIKDVDELLKESESLISGVNDQTKESADGARKIGEMMNQLRQTVASIEDGTGKLTEKSTHIMDVFESISKLAEKNMDGAEKLAGVTDSVKEVSRSVSEVVEGAA